MKRVTYLTQRLRTNRSITDGVSFNEEAIGETKGSCHGGRALTMAIGGHFLDDEFGLRDHIFWAKRARYKSGWVINPTHTT